jgi:lysophospholipid acyltransferase (LPLAT)-like uncharacterized protein
VLKRIRNFFVGWMGWLAIRIIAPTLRYQVKDDSGLISDPKFPKPIIFAFWHNRLFLMPYIYGKFFPNRHVACLVSASQDGEMIARVLSRFGMQSVRGSSSRRAKEAFRELAEALKTGCDVAVTPDGPRGPRYKAHAGVVGLSAYSGNRLIPVACQVGWKIELSTWDRFVIPLPFSTCSIHFGKPMTFSDSTKEELWEDGKLDLEKSLSILN